MPRFKTEPDETFEDVWVVNDSGRVVPIPGDWELVTNRNTGKKEKRHAYPQIDMAIGGQNGWRLATKDEIEETKAAEAANAAKDRAAMKARAEADKEAETMIRAAKSVKKGKATE